MKKTQEETKQTAVIADLKAVKLADLGFSLLTFALTIALYFMPCFSVNGEYLSSSFEISFSLFDDMVLSFSRGVVPAIFVYLFTSFLPILGMFFSCIACIISLFSSETEKECAELKKELSSGKKAKDVMFSILNPVILQIVLLFVVYKLLSVGQSGSNFVFINGVNNWMIGMVVVLAIIIGMGIKHYFWQREVVDDWKDKGYPENYMFDLVVENTSSKTDLPFEGNLKEEKEGEETNNVFDLQENNDGLVNQSDNESADGQ